MASFVARWGMKLRKAGSRLHERLLGFDRDSVFHRGDPGRPSVCTRSSVRVRLAVAMVVRLFVLLATLSAQTGGLTSKLSGLLCV